MKRKKSVGSSGWSKLVKKTSDCEEYSHCVYCHSLHRIVELPEHVENCLRRQPITNHQRSYVDSVRSLVSISAADLRSSSNRLTTSGTVKPTTVSSNSDNQQTQGSNNNTVALDATGAISEPMAVASENSNVNNFFNNDKNAFSLLMDRKKTPVYQFSLRLVDNLLLPSLHLLTKDTATNSTVTNTNSAVTNNAAPTYSATTNSATTNTATTDYSQQIQWKSEMKLKNFPDLLIVYLQQCVNSDPIVRLSDEKRTVRLLIDTNIPSQSESINTERATGRDGERSKLDNFKSLSIPLLKSMIQKAVRRRQTSKVVKLAMHLCTMQEQTESVLELLRRIPIICLEDCSLHPSLPVVVWLVAACSKGYSPPPYLVDLCISVLGDGSAAETRDFLSKSLPHSKSSHESKIQSGGIVGTAVSSNGCSTVVTNSKYLCIGDFEDSSIRALIGSVAIRASFGGMHGDIEMMYGFIELWTQRLASTKKSVCTTLKNGEFKTFELYLHPSYVKANTVAKDTVKQNKSEDNNGSELCVDPSTLSVWWQKMLDACSHRQDFAGEWKDIDSAVSCHGNPSSVLDESGSSSSRSIDVGNIGSPIIRAASSYCNAVIGSSKSDNKGLESFHLQNVSRSILCAMVTITFSNNGRTADLNADWCKLRVSDLVTEGIDFHCDYRLIPWIKERIGSEDSAAIIDASNRHSSEYNTVEHMIKKCIWLYRSSSNFHKVWELENEQYDQEALNTSKEEQQEKSRYKEVWKIICPLISSYCNNRLRALQL